MTDPRDLIAKSPMSTRQVLVVGITIALNALDGFDVLSISFASPGIAAEWGITRAALGFVLSMELIGMALGSVFLGSLADKIGRRPTVLGCLVVMATGMFMATTSTGVLGGLVTPLFALLGYTVDVRLADLSVWRIITGLGIGGMLAAINAVVAEFSNTRRRDLNVAIMSIGYPVGAALGGFITSTGLELAEWRSVFYFGATVTIVMIPIVYFLMPESVHWLTRKQPAGALDRINRTLATFGHPTVAELPTVSADMRKRSTADMFRPPLVAVTVLATMAYFFHITTFYFIVKWVPNDRGRHGLRSVVRRLRAQLAERGRRDWRHRPRSSLAALQRQDAHDHCDAALDGRRDVLRALACGSRSVDVDLHGRGLLHERLDYGDVRDLRESVPDARARLGYRLRGRRRPRRVGAGADHCRLSVFSRLRAAHRGRLDGLGSIVAAGALMKLRLDDKAA